MHPSKIASAGDLPSVRCASSAKSIIMMAFFLTRPTSMMTPTNANRSRSNPEHPQRHQRAETGRRHAGENRDRMDETFVEHAEHQVDDENRHREQNTEP